MVQEGLKDKAAMLAIYITEAHAMDEWPINSARCNGDRGPVNVLQPTADEERCNLARTFKTNFDFRVPMVVDPVSNPFDEDFAPWPLRFYILHKGKLAHKAFPINCSYDIWDVKERLLKLLEAEPAVPKVVGLKSTSENAVEAA